MARRSAGGSMKTAGLILALLLALSVVSAMSLRIDPDSRERRELDVERQSVDGEESQRQELDLDDRREWGRGREERERERERERRERERRRELDSDDEEDRRRGESERERERRERERREVDDERHGSRREREREERERRERRREFDSDDEEDRRRGGRERRERERREDDDERRGGRRERRERQTDSRRERRRRFRGEGERELELGEPREEFSSEGGDIRVWDQIRALEQSDVYVEGARIRLRERGLLLPKYADSASIAYVEEGEGLVGLLTGYSLGETARRVRRGDVIAIPRGIAQWWYNSGNEDLRIIALADTSIGIERGDREYTPFALIGGRGEEEGRERRRRGGRREEELQGILHGFRREFLAEAWDADESEVDELLDSQRGVGIIRVERDIDIERALNVIDSAASTDDDNSHLGEQNTHLQGYLSEFAYNVRHGTPDLRVEDAGHFTTVNRFKLPILNIVRLGLTHGRLERNAICAPHWSPNGHQILHILRGSGRLEIVGNGGEQLVSQEVSEGDVFVIPRFHPAGTRAGEEGLEWVTFHTTDLPYVEALAGKTSVYKNLPEQVAAAAFNLDEERLREFRGRRLRSALLLPSHGRSERRRQRHAVAWTPVTWPWLVSG